MIERLNTTQSDGDEAERKTASEAMRADISKNRKTKPKTNKKPSTRKADKPESKPSDIGKVYSLNDLLAMKRKDLEKLAKDKGITAAHLAANKDDIANMLAEKMDVDMGNGITMKQELFCQLYASDVEFFGNGTQSYMEAYDVHNYPSAMAAAARLLRNVKVLERIDEIIASHDMNDQMVDKQIAFWIRQKSSPQASIAAIKEYNLLKGRTGSKGGVNDLPTVLILQQNQQIHFDSPKARGVIEKFDQWLMENTKAPQPSEREQQAQPAQVIK